MERPNTVAGLIEKRRELTARLELTRAELKSLTIGIDALDVALKLFGADGSNAKRMRLPPAHPAAKGEFQRAALDLFRESGITITSQMLADHFCKYRELAVDDATLKAIRYRSSNALSNMKNRGMIRRVGSARGANARWALVEGFDLNWPRF